MTSAYTDLELLRMQVEALYLSDDGGRLSGINEPEPSQPAPRFFLGRTSQGNLWRTRFDLPPDLTAALEQLAADEPVARNLAQSPRYEAEYLHLLNAHQPRATIFSGPAYTLPAFDPPDQAVMITPENKTLVLAHFSWLFATLADYAPVAAVIADEAAVAVCFSSRLTPRAAAAGVYTEAGYRGRGYAADAVRAWAAAVRASGRVAFYDTSWTNAASQAVARKLGAVQYGADYSIT